MNNKSFWNEVAKYGLLLGLAMGGSKLIEQSLGMNVGSNLNYAYLIIVEWLLFAALYLAVLFKATKRRAALADPKLGFTFAQSVSYMTLISLFVAVPVACIFYIYINSIIGYDTYIEGIIATITATAELQPLNQSEATLIEQLIEQLRSQAQPSIFEVLFSTITQYVFAGLFAGMILGGFTQRKPQIFDNENE